jgi:hypothetical protein
MAELPNATRRIAALAAWGREARIANVDRAVAARAGTGECGEVGAYRFQLR